LFLGTFSFNFLEFAQQFCSLVLFFILVLVLILIFVFVTWENDKISTMLAG